MIPGVLLALSLAVTIRSDFEGGSIGRIEQVAPNHFRCGVRGEVDQDQRNRQASWYYFRIDGAAGYRLSLQVLDGKLGADGQISAGADGRIKLRVIALSGETPLTPLTNLLNGREVQDKKAQETCLGGLFASSAAIAEMSGFMK